MREFHIDTILSMAWHEKEESVNDDKICEEIHSSLLLEFLPTAAHSIIINLHSFNDVFLFVNYPLLEVCRDDFSCSTHHVNGVIHGPPLLPYKTIFQLSRCE